MVSTVERVSSWPHAVPLLVLALLSLYTGWQLRPARMARLGPNAWIGMRSGNTTASAAAWQAGHAASWPLSRLGSGSSLVVFPVGVLGVTLAPASAAEVVSSAAGIGGTVLLMVFLVLAYRRADRAARSVLADTAKRR